MDVVARLLPWLLLVLLTLGCSGGARVVDQTSDASAPTATATSSARRTGFARDDRGALVAFQVGQRFTATIDAAGATFAGLDAAWHTSLRLASVGRAGSMRAVASARPEERDQRVELARGEGVTEWFVHEARGVEHGVDIATRPAGEGALVLEIAIEGLTPEGNGAGVVLRDGAGRAVLHYDELVVRDVDGRVLVARMEAQDGRIALRVEDDGARYPIVVDPLVWGQRAQLVADDGAASDSFGISVALSGTTALVGAAGKTVGSTAQQGAAYVFVQSGTTWTQQAKLVASDGATNDGFGFSVALSGTTALVGAWGKTVGSNAKQGAAYVFVQSGTTWTQQAKLVASDGATNDGFGFSVALSGTTAVVGAYGKKVGSNVNQGAAYVFVQSGTTWTQQAKVVASDGAPEDYFGSSVALSGTTALVGAGDKAAGANVRQGAAYVFVQSGTTWTQQAKLVAADGAEYDNLGHSVALNGNTALVGAYAKTVGAVAQGAAYVFVRSGTVWTQQAKLVAADGAYLDYFGSSVALSGTTALVGARHSRGAAYLFVQSGTTWTQQAKVVALDEKPLDYFGTSVALSGTTVLVGADQKTVGSNAKQGAVYVFVHGLTNADACASAADCVSGFCVDGVCCDTACTGACRACTAAKKGSGANGTCGNIADGTDPDLDCAGVTCSGATQENGHTCNGAGACRVTTTTACAPYLCGTTACKSACAGDADCDASHYCAAPTCVAKKSNGATCAADRECTSAHCVDGVCCDTGCSGNCQACVLAATGQPDGTCALVVDGKDPRGACASSGASCTGATLTNQVCNGSGACRNNSVSCAPFTCTADGKGCATSCATDAECGAAQYCDATHTCATKKARGAACAANAECGSAFCVDGVCCDSKCDGQCQACAEPSNEGTCVAVKGAPRAPRAACNGTDPKCAGQCDGVNLAACAYPSAGQTCGDGCSGGRVSVCDATGTCLAPSPCAGNLACDAITRACKTSCVVDEDCAAGYLCAANKCMPKPTATCSEDGLSSISGDKGTTKGCGPYKCDPSTGNCFEGCATTEQHCAPDRVCDDTSKLCVPTPPRSGDSGGCAVGTRGEGAGFAGLALLGLLRRRRR